MQQQAAANTLTKDEFSMRQGAEAAEPGEESKQRDWRWKWHRLITAFLWPARRYVPWHVRLMHFCWKMLFVGIGLLLFLSGQNTIHPVSSPAPISPMPASTVAAPEDGSSYPGQGAGNMRTSRENTTTTAIALEGCEDDIFKDATCWLQHRISDVVGWTVHGIYDPLYPFTHMIFQSPVNIVYQTPKELTYTNSTVKTWTQNMQAVAAAAFGLFLAIAAINHMVGRHVGMRPTEVTEVVLRASCAFIASQVSLYFVQLFIDCNNHINEFLWGMAQLTFLQSVVNSFFTFDLFRDGWVLVVLTIMLSILVLLLLWQMFVRIVMLTFLIVVSPLGLLCFAIPFTEYWGKLWLRNFTTTVFVQFFQVALITLGCALGMQLINDTGEHLWKLFLPDTFKQPLNFLGLLMAGICFYLALKLPGMLQKEWIFFRTADAAGGVVVGAVAEAGQRAGEAAKSAALAAL